MKKEILLETVARLVKSPKGILAIDESLPTCNKRFEKLDIPTTEEKRREYREILITAPGIEKYISGYIFFDETIRQETKDGRSFVSVLKEKGIEVGIKVDQGLIDFPGHPFEKITKGLEGLAGRLKEYKNMGATFAKFRTVYQIGENIPSFDAMKTNAITLAKYARACQDLDIVPIIEPEVLVGGDYFIEQSYDVNAKNLDIVFSELKNLNVFIPGVILKTSFVFSGKEANNRAPAERVAEMTAKCLKEHVPADLGGIAFISGGQPGDEATVNLNAMHQTGPFPWPVTFSYARAIQNDALAYWAKNPEDVSGAQKLLVEAAEHNSRASIGKYHR